MPFKPAHLGGGRHVPDTDRLVPTPRDESLAVRRKSKRVHFAGMPLDAAAVLARGNLPEEDFVLHRRSYCSPVRGKGDDFVRASGCLEPAHFSSRGDVNQAEVATFEEHLAVWGEGEGLDISR